MELYLMLETSLPKDLLVHYKLQIVMPTQQQLKRIAAASAARKRPPQPTEEGLPETECVSLQAPSADASDTSHGADLNEEASFPALQPSAPSSEGRLPPPDCDASRGEENISERSAPLPLRGSAPFLRDDRAIQCDSILLDEDEEAEEGLAEPEPQASSPSHHHAASSAGRVSARSSLRSHRRSASQRQQRRPSSSSDSRSRSRHRRRRVAQRTSASSSSHSQPTIRYEDSDVYAKEEPGVGYGPTHLCDGETCWPRRWLRCELLPVLHYGVLGGAVGGFFAVSTKQHVRKLLWPDGSLLVVAVLESPSELHDSSAPPPLKPQGGVSATSSTAGTSSQAPRGEHRANAETAASRESLPFGWLREEAASRLQQRSVLSAEKPETSGAAEEARSSEWSAGAGVAAEVASFVLGAQPDVRLKVGDREILAKKAVLAARSRVREDKDATSLLPGPSLSCEERAGEGQSAARRPQSLASGAESGSLSVCLWDQVFRAMLMSNFREGCTIGPPSFDGLNALDRRGVPLVVQLPLSGVTEEAFENLIDFLHTDRLGEETGRQA